MEFVKLGKNYLIKNSNGKVVSEKEKIELENKELIFKDITGCNCQKETTKKLTKNKKRLKEIEQEEKTIVKIKDTAQIENGDVADDTIKEADTTI